MPPALSDDEAGVVSSGDDQIPAKPGKSSKLGASPQSDDDEEGGEDEYVVEEIVSHQIAKGTTLYDVKWQGYEDPADRTWEPEDNLEGALDVLHEYWEKIGGRPLSKSASGAKRKSRKSIAENDTSNRDNKRMKKEREWSLPPGSWEDVVECVESVEQRNDPRTGKPSLIAYLIWRNDRKTQHPLDHVEHKCPQKLLAYYRAHLVFAEIQADADILNGDANMQGAEDDL